MDSASQFEAKILRRKTSPEEYRLYVAGLEWDLIDPIVIETRADLKSEHRWRGRVEPFQHQVSNLITFCRRLPVTLLADDVGLGKTISAGLIISELISRSRLSKILIVCPKLLGPQWQEELRTKFDIPSEVVVGKDLIDADPDPSGAIITTYSSARLHLDKVPEDRFQMLVLDEAHKLRNLYGVETAPQVALRFRKALEQRRFQFVLMLTATPIQNRLWDLYSLADLLSVARGHENPFGGQGMFARKYIADRRDQARQLKPEARDEFRSIVYGYMSRVRRGDANLYFPDRIVQMHRVPPTQSELKLISTIAKPIQALNRLAQISILQALTSSPDALSAQLNNMARKGTVPAALAAEVQDIVRAMEPSAKLQGLGALIDKLKRENPERWRLVVFTGRIETQTTIQTFLEQRSLKVGTINGMSGPRNQDTIKKFWANPPAYHVIVSTEAGSEGVNLQVANVLVNFDLPWNPMIVEQRIGRIQRLASEHANVAIFNVILSGTFEEFIVGRLMEKLQMASHAVGDVEALLEASGIDDDESASGSFDEQIRRLIVAALAGKDVDKATRQAEESIAEARRTLEREQENIDSLFGSMDGAEYVGPRAPKLPATVRSMDAKDFAIAALGGLGAQVTSYTDGLYVSVENGAREYIRFADPAPSGTRSTLYAPGSAAFGRLVDRFTATGIFDVEDIDDQTANAVEAISRRWVMEFGASLQGLNIESSKRNFDGRALLRVRATVAHDSYERLVQVSCLSKDHSQAAPSRGAFAPISHVIDNPTMLGLSTDALVAAAEADPAIAEFRRFYLERRAQEIKEARGNERKHKKLEDDFTPRLAIALVGVEGKLHRQARVEIRYKFDDAAEYGSVLVIIPHSGEMKDLPPLGRCAISGRSVPRTCLKRCAISGDEALAHLLVASEISSRLARPDLSNVCSLSGKRILRDEGEVSAVTGKLVAGMLLKTSAISGRRAEPTYFGRCEFTGAEVLSAELAISQASGKLYRIDEQIRSDVSGRTGHKQEFLFCHETRPATIYIRSRGVRNYRLQG